MLSRRALIAQPTLLQDLPTPIVCIGDLHGDLHTLARIVQAHGMPPQTNYLFLGDLVDRCAFQHTWSVCALYCWLHT
jgi:hypothetical protein